MWWGGVRTNILTPKKILWLWCSWASLGCCCSPPRRRSIGHEWRTTSGLLSPSKAGKCAHPTDAASAESTRLVTLILQDKRECYDSVLSFLLEVMSGLFYFFSLHLAFLMISCKLFRGQSVNPEGFMFAVVLSCLRIGFKLGKLEKGRI